MLGESEARALLAAIVESSNDAIVSKTLEGVITSWNRGAEMLFGYTAEEAVGRSITMIIPPDRRGEEVQILARLRRGETIDPFETVRQTKDGRLLDISLTVSPLRSSDGRIVGASKVARNITEHKRVQQQLAQSEQRYRSLIEATSSIVWTTDAQGKVVQPLPDWQAYTGQTWEQYRGDGWVRALHPDDRLRIKQCWDQAVRTRSSYHVAGRVWHADSRAFRHFDGRGVPIIDADGTIREWIGAYLDVHDRKTAEEALWDSRQQLERLLGLLPTAVYSCDADGVITYFNERAVEVWGRRPESGDADERFCGSESLFHPDGVPMPHDQTPMAEALRDGTSFRNREVVIRRPDGARVWALVNIDPLRDRAGRITGAVNAFVDISGLKRIQEQLKSLNEELEHRVAERTRQAEHRTRQLRALARQLTHAEEQERRRLAADLHDNLVQLLAVCKIQLGLMNRRLNEAPQKCGELVASLEELLDDSIHYTRTLMSDLTPPTLNKGNLVATIDWVARKLAKHQLTVRVEAEGELSGLDEETVVVLFQSVRELLFNVVKHSGVNEATVRMRRDGDHVVVSVADHGRGFDTSRPIEPHSEGGFGLFHLRERLDLLGGKLVVRSTHGQGTTITIKAPCSAAGRDQVYAGDDHKAAADDEAWDAELASDNAVENPIRVLLIDDHAMVREGLRRIMQQYPDVEVVGEASDGEAGVTSARQLSPDVVLMDVNLPKLNGPDATRRIRRELPAVHVIGLSIHNDAQVISAMRDAGAAAYLTKAEASESLYSTIRALAFAESV